MFGKAVSLIRIICCSSLNMVPGYWNELLELRGDHEMIGIQP